MGNLRMNADQISYKGGEKPMSVEEAIKNAGNTGLAHTADIAPDFSAESAYNAGDLVYHNGTLYVFTANHAAGAWSTEDTQAVTVGGELTSLMSGLTSVETSLTSMDRVISFPFTMPNDSSSRAVGENIGIDLSETIPETAYIIGVSVYVFAQKRTIVGEYFGQVGFDANHIYLVNVLKAIPSYYDGISGYLIVGIPHT